MLLFTVSFLLSLNFPSFFFFFNNNLCNAIVGMLKLRRMKKMLVVSLLDFSFWLERVVFVFCIIKN
jgi:hypothetical protein